jgi:hypothetical protein
VAAPDLNVEGHRREYAVRGTREVQDAKADRRGGMPPNRDRAGIRVARPRLADVLRAGSARVNVSAMTWYERADAAWAGAASLCRGGDDERDAGSDGDHNRGDRDVALATAQPAERRVDALPVSFEWHVFDESWLETGW